ncbi:ALA-interacting subunit 1-like isoform X1 [Juglans microcarpa x Juglans regia]|uniref:ALA-interacting subunit 1-like isoform X1 n=1 Tax=Juglans microcarpa x Juglans regia TaxID=2249226 RepID=UPI001B7EE654|nr:ALA-interacting subunit 1-like isoform X1 [Juglans microcarpa x Juglans regia]
MAAKGATSSGGAKDGTFDSSSSSKKNSKKPKYSRFTQQELPACKPILTPGWVYHLEFYLHINFWFQVITTFIVVGIIFIPIGFASLFASEWVVEIVDRYDGDCVPHNYTYNKLAYIQNSETNKTCMKRLIVPKQMKSPVYIYYQLDNFYQNHRRYVKSRSDKQLRSRASERDTSSCKPEAVGGNNYPIVPCGLIAWSLFNDTYGFSVKNKMLEVSKKNIAWKSDREHKFGSDVYPKNFQSGGLIGGAKLNASIPLSEQEDLIVWMRTAALPTFRKLYGKIETDLEANDEITVVIQNNYNIYSFGGKKSLVLSTTSWIGGKNDFLGVAYLTVGGLCLFLAISFIFLYVIMPRPLGDPSYLSWNRGQVN